MTLHFAVGKTRKQKATKRCKFEQCAQLTRHNTQLCPEHRSIQ